LRYSSIDSPYASSNDSTLSSTGQPFVYVDDRRAYDDVSRRVSAERLYEELRSSLLRLSVRERVLEALGLSGRYANYT